MNLRELLKFCASEQFIFLAYKYIIAECKWMALDNWFQTWHPPPGLFNNFQPFPSPFDKSPYSTNTSSKGHDVNFLRPDTFLPYLLSLGLARSKPEKHNRINNGPLEVTGPFKTWYHWNLLDFDYSPSERSKAIIYDEFIPENNLPLGIEVYKDRLFMTMPKWKSGVPATLAVLPRVPKEPSPKLKPYPSWSWHKHDSCDGIISVFRVQADSCGRLWVLDSGQIDITINPKQICNPKILIFDLKTDKVIRTYELPKAFIKQDSLYSNILVDIRDNDCINVHAYLTDVWRFGLVVYSYKKNRSWRITDHLFYPDPLAARYKLHDLEFDWTDGVFGLALSPYEENTDRILYFHPMSSFREFYVKTSVICNETGWMDYKNAFKVIGQSRGASGHVSASRIDRNGIMFYNMVTRDTIGCWDTRKPYKRDNLGVVARSPRTLIFPNDLKIDAEKRQSVWIITNALPYYLYRGLDKNKINFRVLSAYVDDAINGTICDPNVAISSTYQEYETNEDCY